MMDIPKLIEFFTLFFVDYASAFITVIRRPNILLFPSEYRQDKPTFSSKLFGFATISIILGLVFHSKIKGGTGSVDYLQSIIIITIMWLIYSGLVYTVCANPIIGLRTNFFDLSSIILQIVATLYVIANIITLIWQVFFQVPGINDYLSTISSVFVILGNTPMLVYFIVQPFLIIIYLPAIIIKTRDFRKITSSVRVGTTMAIVILTLLWSCFGMFFWVTTGVVKGIGPFGCPGCVTLTLSPSPTPSLTPTETPTPISCPQVTQAVFDKEKVLEYLRDIFFWWTLTGDTRNDSESEKYLLSAFDSILSLNEMEVSSPKDMMQSWIDYAIDKTVAAGVCTNREQCSFLKFDISGTNSSLGIEESFWRLWEHVNKLPTDDIKIRNIAEIRLALIELVGTDCQKELIGKWNDRLEGASTKPTVDTPIPPTMSLTPNQTSSPSIPVFIQAYFFGSGDSLRLLRCESSKWNCTNGFPGSVEYVDFPKMRSSLQEIISIIFFTTSDKVVIGDFIENNDEISANVLIQDSGLDNLGLYNSAYIDINERKLEVTMFDKNGHYFQPQNIDALGWNQAALKNALKDYLIATVSNISPKTIEMSELSGKYYSDGSGDVRITFVYSRKK